MRTILETGVALLSLAGIVTWAAAASAQTTTTTTDKEGSWTQTTTAAPPPTPAPATPSSQTVNIQQPAAQPVATTTTTAAPVYVENQPAHSETVEVGETTPNGYLIWTGAALVGISWGASAIVSAESHHQGDGHLWVPLVGPWLDLGDRGNMPNDSNGHDTEVTNRVFLVVDGVVQAIGTLEIVSGFLFPTTHYDRKTTNATETSALKPQFRLTPMKLSKTGYGFGAIGTF